MKLLWAAMALAVALLAACGGDDGDGSGSAEARVLVACNDSNDGGDAIRAADLTDDLKNSLPTDVVASVVPDGACVRVTFSGSATAEERQEIQDTVGELPGIVEMRYDD